MSSSQTTRASHRLSGGLFVSGPREKPKEKSTMSSSAVPYTGGDLKRSGDLAKMFELPSPTPTGPSTPTGARATHSGPLGRVSSQTAKKSNSFSGPLAPALPATGLITSGPSSASSSTRMSGGQGQGQGLGPGGGSGGDQTPRSVVRKKGYGSAVTTVGKGREYGFAISTASVLAGILALVLLLTLGVFLLVAVKNMVVLAAAVGVIVVVAALALWNLAMRDKGLEAFLRGLPDTDLHGASNEQFVKVTGVVTCGSIPLETSYQGTPRCVFVSTELCEYRGLTGKQANPNHMRLTWGLRYSEKHVADFYISDSKRGTRALVKAGHGTKIVCFVKPTNKLTINKKNKEMHPAFMKWLDGCNLSYDDRTMCIEEGYLKEGSSITVMGILQRHDNILMIVPPEKPVMTGCLWSRLLLSMHIRGLVLVGDKNPNDEVVTV